MSKKQRNKYLEEIKLTLRTTYYLIQKSTSFCSPAHWMALHGHASIARLILTKGAGLPHINKLLDLHSGTPVLFQTPSYFDGCFYSIHFSYMKFQAIQYMYLRCVRCWSGMYVTKLHSCFLHFRKWTRATTHSLGCPQWTRRCGRYSSQVPKK